MIKFVCGNVGRLTILFQLINLTLQRGPASLDGGIRQKKCLNRSCWRKTGPVVRVPGNLFAPRHSVGLRGLRETFEI